MLTRSTSLRDEADVVVVGAGPSGSTAAAVLGELGHEVLVIDKGQFPREKPCGDGIMHPAVAMAERLGLASLIEAHWEIEVGRVIVSHRRQSTTRFVRSRGRPLPRCIGRADFDAALLGSARERGARVLRARVDEVEKSSNGWRLHAVAGEESFVLGARTVVAADGATSRLRRSLGGVPSPPLAYAVRQYFVTERPLEPVFDIYLPLEIEGKVLAGYGWVFPIDEHTANLGVGFYRDPRGGLQSLSSVFDAFVAELRTKAARRFGHLEPSGAPLGSPLGIRSQIESFDTPGLVLSGDAAGMTHALTGEGIAFAMRGGEFAARVVDRHSKGGSGLGPPLGAAQLRRSFPQLGVDVSMLSRVWSREMDKGSDGSTGSAAKPFLGTAKRMMGESAYETSVEETLAWRALDAHDPRLGESLELANETLLNSLSNRLPFAAEAIHHSTRKHLGPMYAAIALAVAAGGGLPLPEATIHAAVAAESLGTLPELLTMMVDRASSKPLRVNNVFAILTADFAAACALTETAKLGASAVSALALAGQQGCQGGMRDATSRFAPDREIEDWFKAASETKGSAVIFAAQLGEAVRGHDGELPPPLARYATELGIAVRLAEEIVDFTARDEAHVGRAGEALRLGIYPLPVLYAIEARPGLFRLLAQHTAEGGDPSEILQVVRACGALERATIECETRARGALSEARSLLGPEAEVLASLAMVPADYVAAGLPDGSAEVATTF